MNVRVTNRSEITFGLVLSSAQGRVERTQDEIKLTQRRHIEDTSLRVTGPVATEWMSFAQAYAGPAGPGRVAS